MFHLVRTVWMDSKDCVEQPPDGKKFTGFLRLAFPIESVTSKEWIVQALKRSGFEGTSLGYVMDLRAAPYFPIFHPLAATRYKIV